ncbi:MAG: response regulator transcription factor [Bryobacteraceae bacterium]
MLPALRNNFTFPDGSAPRPMSGAELARVVVADDHALVASAMATVVAAAFEVVAIVSNPADLLAAVERWSPELALVDMAMPGMAGIAVTDKILERHAACRVIFLGTQANPEFARDAIQAGASGYVLKTAAVADLIYGMQETLKGGVYLSPEVAREFLNLLLNPGGRGLTPRQRDILRRIAHGQSGKEIAADLELSLRTIQFHKNGIISKLGLRTTAELTRYALENGMA